MNLFKIKSWRLLFLILTGIILMGFSLDNLPLDKEDKKNLEKAAKYKQQKENLINKANAIYSNLEGYNRSDANNIKKIKKLENEAIELMIKALTIVGEANWLENSVYNKVIPVLKSDFAKSNDIPIEINLLEEKTREQFLKAENFRNEADKFGKDESYQKYTKLSEAQKLEIESIENQKELIQYYLGEKSIVFDNQKTESQQIEEVVINEEVLRNYLNYINSKDTLLPVDDFRNLIYSEQLSASNIREVLENYIYTEVLYVDRTDTYDIDIVGEAIAENEAVDKGQFNTYGNNTVLEGSIFKVQVASNKSPLTQSQLKRIYDGNKKLKMINEEGWYKYSIGDFNTYAEADEFKRSLKITDAFVVAYADSKKVNLSTLKKEESEEDKILASLDAIIFKLQIAASRNKLSENQLSGIYDGDEPINMIVEDNWYKYSLGNYKDYNRAEVLKDETNVEGAFIVSYKNGVKVPLYQAKRGIVKEISDQEIVFKVQIAADTQPLSSEKLHNIYSGNENILMYREEGWNKYCIGKVKTFSLADELRKESGVNGAFVVAFKGNEKMDVLEAKKLTRCLDPIFQRNWLKNNTGLIFKVQIAASLKELNESQIKNICCIERNIYVSHEDEWYRYSIGHFTSYRSALKLKNLSKVEGAFIVSYKNSEKINLKEAIKLSK